MKAIAILEKWGALQQSVFPVPPPSEPVDFHVRDSFFYWTYLRPMRFSKLQLLDRFT